MSIILPDGIVYSKSLYEIINSHIDNCYFNILAIISLPVATFSLGGTVAKTSFLVIHKSPQKINSSTYIAVANNIGFLKKGNNKVIDKNGNDLIIIEKEILSNKTSKGIITTKEIAFKKEYIDNGMSLTKNNNILVKEYLKFPILNNCFHISILDVDETGFINLERILQNSPITKPLVCKPYDIIISCINPKIWRAAIIPEINDYVWTCSSEFAVFRCKNISETIKLYFSIMQKNFKEVALSYAKGTSSSRQRINRNELLNIKLLTPNHKQIEEIKTLIQLRNDNYINRLKDLKISFALWGSSS
jgi:hypothetical protein